MEICLLNVVAFGIGELTSLNALQIYLNLIVNTSISISTIKSLLIVLFRFLKS